MKIKSLLILSALIFMPLVAFAEDAAVVATTVSSIAVPPGSPWYASIIAAIFPALMAALIWLSARVSSFIATKLNEAKTSEQGKWYSMALGLAGLAVRMAETKYGPNTATGKEKKADAVNWLKERLAAVDPTFLSKNPNAESLIAGLVDAAYHDAFVAVSPLATAPLPRP